MRIVFGWYSLLIKSYSFKDLGIENESNDKLSIEVRQKCFHLFWIPFFGTGKSYALRKDGQLYELPSDYIALVHAKGNHRTPWYTFSLPILLVFGLIGYFAYEKSEDYKGQKFAKLQRESSARKMKIALSHLAINDYLRIRTEHFHDKPGFLKIEGIQNDTIFKARLFKINNYDEQSKPTKIRDYYVQHKDSLTTVTLTRSQFDRLVREDGREFGYPVFPDEEKLYFIEDIYDLDGPILKLYSSYWPPFKMSIENLGAPVELIEIKNLDGNLGWHKNLPMRIESDDIFMLEPTNYKRNTRYKFILEFKDSLNSRSHYEVITENSDIEIERSF